MTIDKSKTIEIPQWLLSLLISVVGAVFVFWGLWSASKATLELKAATNANNIEILRKEKVNKDEFGLVIDKLNSIEKKLDYHIEKK